MFNNVKMLSGTQVVEKLIDENDYFETRKKAEVILNMLKSQKEEIENIQMIGVFAEWGAGKTTYINHVCEELKSETDYKTVFFEAWKYEIDRELHLSLMECILSNNYNATLSKCKEALTGCFSFLKNIALNTNVNIELPGAVFGLPTVGFGVELGKAGVDTIDEMIKNKQPLSFYGQVEAFKKDYRAVIDKILGKNETLIICIDDLDRCEPENVIALLSMIKHFFTYSKRVKFICMLDKEAVTQAFTVKYGSVVKSHEYLEKLFDLNFSLSPSDDVKKIIRYYVKTDDVETVTAYFNKMGLTNPRRIIKILNRTLLLQNSLAMEKSISKVFLKETDMSSLTWNTGSYFFSLLIYFVIFKEYYPEEFYKLNNLDEKGKRLASMIRVANTNSDSDPISVIQGEFGDIKRKEKFISKAIEIDTKAPLNQKIRLITDDQTKALVALIIPKTNELRAMKKYFECQELGTFFRSLEGLYNNYAYNFLSLILDESDSKEFFKVQNEFDLRELYKFVRDN